ncbi:LysE family translocator [Vogesella indigofera]|uniref:LysE family translocator n=1 Tax=Vogesella indigofera TaxID=45465 RepID=UPI00234E1CAF|nr:LysE family translocator [Vogesella indigofera]MDC7702937.1 LysE family translocator [Vogesella indigofera]
MMLTPDQIVAFLAAAMLITLSPGPDNLMVLSLGIARGRRHGMVFGLGCALGCLSHTLLAAAGISALLAASATAFLALKLAGGLYLVWLGVQALRSHGRQWQGGGQGQQDGLAALFGKGLLANAINPKVVLFFLAFLPQFIVADGGAIAWQTLQLGVLFTLQAALLFGLLGYFSGYAGQWLMTTPRRSMWLDRIAGAVFVALGLRLIFSR